MVCITVCILNHPNDVHIGIGLQVHEAPYLRGGNNVSLAPGNVCSNEPGVYIEGSVCIALLLEHI
jgi:Xaa-Pro aminopeptidase